jgi:hypothetical protein
MYKLKLKTVTLTFSYMYLFSLPHYLTAKPLESLWISIANPCPHSSEPP